MQHIRAVAFDMDGLLFDTERLDGEGWIAAGRARGIPIGREISFATLGLSEPDTRAVFERLYGPGHDFDAVRADVLQYILDRIDESGVPLKDGAIELIDYLDAEGIPYALATSNMRERALCYLRKAGLERRFRYLACGDLELPGKPEPDIFLRAAELMGAAPAETLVLEDAPQGIEAARRAGMPSVMVPDLAQPDENVRRSTLAVVSSLREVIPLIREANSAEGCISSAPEGGAK